MRSELEQYQNSIKEFNESARLGFESFIQSNGSDRNKLQLRCTPFTDKKGSYGSFDLDFGLSVYQHQQSKVEELQKQKSLQEMEINHLSQANQAWKLKCDELTKDLEEAALSQMKLYEENNELQKQVDEAQKLIDDWNCGGVHIFDLIDELEQALKGGCDESN